MEGCLQAIRHGPSPVSRRWDCISGRGDLPCRAGGCQGLSNTCARWCDERNCDCFLSFFNGMPESVVVCVVALIRNRCTITSISVSTRQVCRRVSHVSEPWGARLTQRTTSNTIRGLRESTGFITIHDTLILVLHMKHDNKPQPLIYLLERVVPESCCRWELRINQLLNLCSNGAGELALLHQIGSL